MDPKQPPPLDLDSDSDEETILDDTPSYSIPVYKPNGPRSNTDTLRTKLPADGPKLVARVQAALDALQDLGLDLSLLLDLISWESPACQADLKIRAARTSLIHYERLPLILDRWRRPPTNSTGAGPMLDAWALKTVIARTNYEMTAKVGPLLKSPRGDLSEETLLDIDMVGLAARVKSEAPTTWSVIGSLVYTDAQKKRNTKKNPAGVRSFPPHTPLRRI